jgi:hypothetical protein
MFGFGKKHHEEETTVAEGDLITYSTEDGEADTPRVRRVSPNEVELVNRERGSQRVPLACIDGATEDGHVDGTSCYCGICGWVHLSQILTCHSSGQRRAS